MAAVIAEPESVKAATLTPDGAMTFFSFPIEKMEEAEDGTIEVIGKATDGSLDSDLQVVDPDWSSKALQEWYDTGGNVRVQHNASRDPAGKGIHVEGHTVRARVVEPVAVKLVKAGVLQDFSVGIMNPDIRRSSDPSVKHLDPQGKAVNGVITGRADGMSKIGEISLVDRGSNFGTRFAMMKAAATGEPEWVGELTASDEVLAKVAKPAKAKTVTVELPKNMSLSVKPSDLAKLATFKQRLAQDTVAKAAVPAVIKDADAGDPSLDEEPEGPESDDEDATKALKAAEGAVYKRDVPTAERRELRGQGRALDNLSYPVKTHEDADSAVTLILSGHGDVSAARSMVKRIARKEGWTDILDRLKGGKKKAKTAKVATAPDVAKKKKVMCGACGARQNAKHNMCSECGVHLGTAIPVMKNHAFTCLGCGKDLDKGEPHCPGCGKENPGYLPEADHQIPANQDKAAKPKKKAKGKGKKKNPFGDKQAPPFGKDKDSDDDASEKAARVTKGKKGKGKRPTPGSAGGVPGNAEMPAARHREPDGAEVEAFEADAHMEDGDNSAPTAMEERTLKHSDPAMAASLMLSALGVPETMGGLHALTCPAFKGTDVAEAFPSASFAGIDLAQWQAGALTKAASAPLDQAEKALDIWRAAATLKACDPHLLADLRGEAHKMFTDANPGPGTFPTPTELSPRGFNRPYLTAGHAAPSPDQEGPNSAHVPAPGGIMSEDYTRGYLAEGHAADAPENTHQAGPMPAPERTGVPTSGPARQYYTNAARDGARHALQSMHDHIAFSHPDICPMHGGDDIARHPVPTPQGVPAVAPAPGKTKAARKAAKAKARKAAARKRAQERKLTAQVMKGRISVDDARVKLGRKPVTPAEAPEAVTKAAVATPEAPPAPAMDAKAIAKAVRAAVRPLNRKIAGQDKDLRKLRKETARIAAQPDTTNAPFRGSALTKQASPGPAGPVTVADHVEHAKAARITLLQDELINDPNPAHREAARAALMNELGMKT